MALGSRGVGCGVEGLSEPYPTGQSRVSSSGIGDAYPCSRVIDSGRGTTRAEDAQGTPTQSSISSSTLVYEDNPCTTGVTCEKRQALPMLLREHWSTRHLTEIGFAIKKAVAGCSGVQFLHRQNEHSTQHAAPANTAHVKWSTLRYTLAANVSTAGKSPEAEIA